MPGKSVDRTSIRDKKVDKNFYWHLQGTSFKNIIHNMKNIYVNKKEERKEKNIKKTQVKHIKR